MREKTIMLNFRVSPAELERINQKREEIGIRNMGAYLRKMAMDGYCVNLDMTDIRKVSSLLGYAGNNLNQYARRANETGSIYEADIQDLRARLDEILALQKKILVKLAGIR